MRRDGTEEQIFSTTHEGKVMNAPTTHNTSNANEAQFLAPETHPRAGFEGPLKGDVCRATTVASLALDARCGIALARVIDPIDSEAAFVHEVRAWHDAYSVGCFTPDAATAPRLFLDSRTLMFAWAAGKADGAQAMQSLRRHALR